MIDLRVGNSLEVLKEYPDNSVDSVVTDPPYGLSSFDEKKIRTTLTTRLTTDPAYIPEGKGFMGKDWDGFVPPPAIWSEVFRVLKPGGHVVCFASTRTVDLMTISLRLAGFEIRDTIMWLYGSGFPKSLDVSKALDKQVDKQGSWYLHPIYANRNGNGADSMFGQNANQPQKRHLYTPSTDLAKQWHGYGTALKPAVEPAVLARKPLIGTVADNVTTWGVGGINIDGCRVGTDETLGRPQSKKPQTMWQGLNDNGYNNASDLRGGRWPANVILDESAGEALDAQSGARPSRFLYTAKASKAEREAGLEGMEVKPAGGMQGRQDGSLEGEPVRRANHHPTVKPIALMRYLVRLVTPKDGTVLDPFMGSGSTGCAAMCEGVNFVGIELSEEYLEIARRRIEYWQSQNPMGL